MLSLLRPSALLSRTAFVSLFACAILALAAPDAQAQQANLIFSGGSGSPLTVTLLNDLTYQVTGSIIGNFFLDFDAVGGSDIISSGSGSIAFSVNGGTRKTFEGFFGGYTGGIVTPDDLSLISGGTTLAPGDTVTVYAGTFTSTSNYAARLISGTYDTRLTTSGGNPLSSNAAAPEPGTIALLLTAGVPVVGLVRRRAKNHA